MRNGFSTFRKEFGIFQGRPHIMHHQTSIMKHKKKILLVDDDDALLFAFHKIFNDAEVSIEVTDSIPHARERISETFYHLIISDLRFSDAAPTGGIDILKEAHRLSPLSKTALWTAYADEKLKSILEEIHPDYFLEKPVSSEKIKLIVDEIPMTRGDSSSPWISDDFRKRT